MSRLVRVLHVITRLDPGGSAENTLLSVARLNKTRFDVHLAFGLTVGDPGPTLAKARQAGVTLIDIPELVRNVAPLADWRALRVLRRVMQSNAYDIIHTHTSKAGILGRLAARLEGVPRIVHTPHGHVFYGYYGRIVTRLFVWLERWVARFTDCIIALTQSDLEDHLRFNIASRGRFCVIHSGIDFSPFAGVTRGDRLAVRHSLGIDPDGVVIGTVGRLTAIKGQGDLLTGFAAVRTRVANAWLLLVGDGEERGALESQARGLGVAEYVAFAGWREDIPSLLGAMDVFAFPSMNEGMGKALVEAMYVGLPCVATDVGGIPELIRHEQEGLLVAPAAPHDLTEGMIRLLNSNTESTQFGTAASIRARGYSVESMVAQLEVLYEELLDNKVAGR